MAFLSLPEDVLMEVLAPARPIDILALGQTCKAVYRVTSERIVWERKLRNLVKHRNLYAPSLCPHDSTLGALQRTVSGIHLWEKLLKRLSVPPEALEGSATELIREKTAVYFEPDSGTPYLCLVPGGRYLFTGLEKGRDPLTIKLWDLGPVGMPILSAPVLLSQYEIRFDGTPEQPYRDVSFAVWVSDLDALDLRLVAVFTRMGVRNGGVFVAKVFAISPGNPNPEFKELGSLYCDVRPEQRTALILPIRLHWVFEDMLLIKPEHAYLLWNFKEGWYADWSEEGDTAEYYMFSALTKDYVITPDKTGISIWSTNLLPKCNVPQHSSLTAAPLVLGFSSVLSHHRVTWPSLRIPSKFKLWVSGPNTQRNLPFIFDIFFGCEGLRIKLDNKAETEGEGGAFQLTYLAWFILGPVDNPSDLQFSPHVSCNDRQNEFSGANITRIKHAGLSFYSIHPTASNMAASRSGSYFARGLAPEFSSMVVDILPSNTIYEFFTACPVSGRVVQVLVDEESLQEERVPVIYSIRCIDIIF